MEKANPFIERYKSGDIPWDAGQPDSNLIEGVTRTPILACKALDVGCGTGDNPIWLARQGFEVTGTDISEIALEAARAKACNAGVACAFVAADFMRETIPGAPFGFVFDRGCFHSFDAAEEKSAFARSVAAHLAEGGLWLTLAGNADEPRLEAGPPRMSAVSLATAVEPFFEILSLTSCRFGAGGRMRPPARAWRCLMCKREGLKVLKF